MPRGQLRSARAAVLTYFVIVGLTEGIWIARIPGVKERLHLADGLPSALDSIAAGCVTAAIIAGHRLLPEPAGVRPGPRRPGCRPPPAAERWLLVLGLLALCCVITEGAVGTWSGVYLRDVLATLGWFAAAGFAACGGGLSCTMPQLFSAAGRADPVHPGRAVARSAPSVTWAWSAARC